MANTQRAPTTISRGSLVLFDGFYWPVIAVVNSHAWLTSCAPWRAFRVVPIQRCLLIPNVVVDNSPWEVN